MTHAAGVLLIAGAVALRWVLRDHLGNEAPYLFLLPAAVIAATWCRGRCTVAATLAGAVAVEWLFFSQPWDVGRGLVRLGIMVAAAAYFSYIARLLRLDRDQAVASGELLKSEVQAQASELVKTRDLFRGLIDSAADAIAAVDADLRYVALNPAYQQGVLEIRGKHVKQGDLLSELVSSDPDAEARRATWQRALAGETFMIEYDVTLLSGEPRYYEQRFSPVRNAAGEVVAAVQISRDVTARKMLELEVKQANEDLEQRVALRSAELYASDVRYQQLIELLPLAVCVVDKDGIFQLYNEAAAKLWNQRPPADARKWDIIQLLTLEGEPLPPDQWPLSICLKTGRRVEPQELILQRPDGTQARVLPHPQPIFDETGEVIGAVDVMADITSLVKQQSIIAESERRFRATFDLAAIGMAHVGIDGKWLRVNDKLCAITGYTRAELLERTFMDITHSEDLEKDLHLAMQLRDGVIPNYSMEKRYVRPDGSSVWVNLTGSAARNSDGSPAYYISAIEDISWRKAAEETLQRSEAALKNAIVAAEAASRAKDRFLAMLSHELRTPLTPALTVAHLLEQDPAVDGEIRESMAMIRRNIELEARLIDDLLDLTKISHGKLTLAMRPTSVHTSIRHVLRICGDEVSAKQQKLLCKFDASNPHVNADPARLQQVLWNVVRNAVKFTPEGGEITIRTQNVRKTVRISVEDSGIGIEPDVLHRLFTAFEQGDPAITRSYGGMGLGLSICKGLVTLHGGDIRATSEGKGKGACFTVEFPLLTQVAEEIPSLFPHPPTPAAASHILLVEDHRDTSRVMARLLRAQGHDVQIAHTVADAKRLIAGQRFDLLVSDLGLPDGTGCDVVEAFGGNGTRAIALSGYGQQDDMEKTAAAGFQEHLVKPVNPEALLAAVARVLTPPDAASATQPAAVPVAASGPAPVTRS